MALTGTFDDISFAELLQLLNVSHKSGRLSIWRGTDRAELFVVEGNVARAVYRRERGPEVVYRVLGWRAGEFSFQPSDEAVAREITESTEALILEGIKRLDEWERVETQMPDTHVVLRQRASAVNERYDSLSPEAQSVLRLVDARRNVATIVRESGLQPMAALRGVTELLSESMVEEWAPPVEPGEVLAAVGKLPQAQGALDFGRRTYLAPNGRPQPTPRPARVPADEQNPDS